MSWFRNTITNLYNAVSAPVAATPDALAARLESVRESATLLYERTKQKLGYGQPLKGIVEEQANQDYIGIEDIKHLYTRAKTQPTDNGIQGMRYLFDEHDMRLIEDGRRVKTWRLTKNLNLSLTDTIMRKAAPDIDMRTKVVYSFEVEIHRGAREIVDYSKVLRSPPGMFTSLQEIREYIEECEQKRLDLENEEVWSKAYLPATRTTKVKGNYQGKVVFKHVEIKLIVSNEPLMACGLLPKLSREFYSDNKLKRKDVGVIKLVDFEGIAKHLNVNIMLYESKNESGQDAGKIWRLVYGKTQYKDTLPTINMGLFKRHCFYINKIDVSCQNWECKGCKQIFKNSCNLTRHLKEDRCTRGKTKIICLGKKLKRILNSSEKVFYGGETEFSYSACQ